MAGTEVVKVGSEEEGEGGDGERQEEVMGLAIAIGLVNGRRSITSLGIQNRQRAI